MKIMEMARRSAELGKDREPALVVGVLVGLVVSVIDRTVGLTPDEMDALLFLGPIAIAGIVRFFVYSPATVKRIRAGK